MNEGTESDDRAILHVVAARWRLAATVALAVAVVTIVVQIVAPPSYRGSVVVVPVPGSRTSVGLNGAASLLNGLDLGTTGFDATRDVVAYLLRSRTVLLKAAQEQVHGQSLAKIVADRELNPNDEEQLLTSLRRVVRVTTSKETGFVTVTVDVSDSAAMRAMIKSVVSETQGLFARVAQSQARQLLRAQERRLDSARATLKRVENELLAFDTRNRVVPPRSSLSLERARLERDVTEADRVYEKVTLDRQVAIARQLEDAPAIAVVEDLPTQIAPWPKQTVVWATLLGLAAGLASLMVILVYQLTRVSGVGSSSRP